jgi:preprotein translocase subunit SecA
VRRKRKRRLGNQVVGILTKIFGSQNERELKRMWPLVEQINSFEAELKKLSDAQLEAKTGDFKTRLERGESLDEILPEAFAVVRETSVRVLHMRHFDVQLLGGVVLHEGTIAEMKTGEGKTLCATLPIYLNALTGKGVHLVTVNDYLARRDAEWMGSIYKFLGMSVGVVLAGLDPTDRQEQYNADITYGQNNEFGFDYLRDNMKLELSEKAQREHNYAIVDEVDSILVDEARTPLIISGPSEKATETYNVANEVMLKLRADEHYSMDLKSKQVSLTEDGVHAVELVLGIDNLYDPRNMEMVHHINQALKAHVTMKRDVDYIVRDGQVLIVDEFTGRILPGRRWSDGLHQAVEAKEHVKIQRENQTLATITFQNYFRMYKKLAGMTGTADTEAVEFKKIYNLDVIVVPTNEPMIRIDNPDVVYSTEKGKFRSVIKEIEELNEKGQPILCGTASIEKSEVLSELLSRKSIPHHVLNAKQHEREAEIVAQAGRLGAVTISTNMAGRGTDILLGGNPEFLAAAEVGTKDPADPDFNAALEHYQKLCAEEKQQVLAAGGLHILGTERHESRRIDNQLRGRSGRQGDPGSSRFYVSLEDDLMKRFGGERMQSIMARVGLTDDDAIEGTLVARAIENAQKKVEGHHFDIRKHLLEYDDVMNKQREVIYGLREKILRAEDAEERVPRIVGDAVEELILSKVNEKEPADSWDVAGIIAEFSRQFAIELSPDPFVAKQKGATKALAQELFDELKDIALQRYEERRQRFGPERMSKLEQIVHLQAIDFFWKEHLTNIDQLKEGIGLRGYAQKNPLYEYQREAFELFNSMMSIINSSLLQNLYYSELPSEEELRELEEKEKEAAHAREAAAREIHESVVEENPSGDGEKGLNRERRRKLAREQAARQGITERDYAPTAVTQPAGMKVKKDVARKKKREAKKARRKNR